MVLARGCPVSLSHRPWSASTLSAFDACPRRVAWGWGERQPAFPTEAPSEGLQANEVGAWLHRLAEWQGKGFDVAPLLARLAEGQAELAERLGPLWAAYQERPEASASPCWPELQLELPIAGGRAIAKLDRVVREGDRFWIVDWKTGQLRPELLDDWQAWLYPYALVEAGALLNQGQRPNPDLVGMRFVGLASGTTLEVRHSQARHQEAHRRLTEAFEGLQRGLDPTWAEPRGLSTGWCERSRCPYLTRCAAQSPNPLALPPAPPSGPEDELLPSLGGLWADGLPGPEGEEDEGWGWASP